MHLSHILWFVRYPHYREVVLRKVRDRIPAAYWLVSGLLFKPKYRNCSLNVTRSGAMGDVLMCTPALREAYRRNPNFRVMFYTNVPEILTGLPYVSAIRPADEAPPGTIYFTYEECIPPRRHIARLFGDLIGVRIKNVRPDCPRDPSLDATWRDRLAGLPRPWVIVNRRAGPFTPNKDWPAPYWDETVASLNKTGSVIEIGQAGLPSTARLDLRGRTSLNDLISVMAVADVHVGPISGPVHIAAAVDTPAVVIYGGYEDPVCSAYPGNINIVNRPKCSPCWLRSPCPHDLYCLKSINPRTVLAAIRKILSRQRQIARF
jgi:ADP-heptose:LPS heptosyltransferase